MEYKCKNCGGPLRFDPKIDKLKCDFCGNTYDLSEYEDHLHTDHDHDHTHDHDTHYTQTENPGFEAQQNQYVKAMDDSTDEQKDLTAFECPHCGAEVVTDKNTAATTCVFCGTPMVIQESVQGKFRPDKVIPFEVDKKQIEKLYEDYIRTKPFYPDAYSKANVISKIKAVYLPFWLYDAKMNGSILATGERTFSFRTGQWIVTNHEVYDLYRQGSMHFEKIPVIASSKTPVDAMDSIEPYDYSKLVDYNPGYLPGFLATRYDQSAEQKAEKMKGRALDTLQSSLANTIRGVEGFRVLDAKGGTESLQSHYALLPAYLLFMDYDHDEDKLIAINGQTGKIVGNVPVDNKKKNRYFLKMFLIFLAVFILIGMAILVAVD